MGIRRSALLLSVVLIGVLLVPGAGRANGNEALAESYRATLSGGGVVSEGVGLATRAGGPDSGSIAIGEVPAGATIEKAFLYWAVLAGEDDQVTFAGQSVTGALIGRSADTCWFSIVVPNPAEDNRVYRADVTNIVPGNGVYSISGVGDGGVDYYDDGQGASLVVVYAVPGDPGATTVVINDGGLTGGPPGPRSVTIEHTFQNLGVPQPPTAARLHVGVGDTSANFDDDPMTFAGTPVTPANFFSGSDGALWDDATLDLPISLLPSGTTQAANAIDVRDDCMVWVYAALELRLPLPPLEINQPQDGVVLTDPNVAFAGTAESGVAAVRLREGANVIAPDAPVATGAWGTTVTLGDGTHTVTATAVDGSGQELSPADIVTFTVQLPPQLEITQPQDGALFNSPDVDLAGTATQLVDKVRLREGATLLAETPASGGAWAATVSLGDGTHMVTATAVNASGQELSPSRSVSFTIDTQAPQATITSPRGAGFGLTATPVSGSASDNLAVAEVHLSYTKVGTGGLSFDTMPVLCPACGTTSTTWSANFNRGRGGYVVTAEVTDAAGNTASSAPVLIALASG